MICTNCNGNGNGWPERSVAICGGLPCPVCNGVCEVCLGELLPGPDNPDDYLPGGRFGPALSELKETDR